MVKAFVHLAVVGRYGYHGDELYFLECGRHLAFGYVDHPPLVPWALRPAAQGLSRIRTCMAAPYAVYQVVGR